MASLETAVAALVSVIYVSSAPTELTGNELADLLSDIRDKNKRRGITGMLLYRGGNFLQVIEGPASEVDHLVSLLKVDQRHKGMIILRRSEIQDRQFSKWQMAFRDITSADLRHLEGYSSFMDLSFTDAEFQAQPHVCYRLLLQFKEMSR